MGSEAHRKVRVCAFVHVCESEGGREREAERHRESGGRDSSGEDLEAGKSFPVSTLG